MEGKNSRSQASINVPLFYFSSCLSSWILLVPVGHTFLASSSIATLYLSLIFHLSSFSSDYCSIPYSIIRHTLLHTWYSTFIPFGLLASPSLT